MFQKVVLAICALVFVGVGIAFISVPDALLPSVHIDAPSGTAKADIRAVYGGLDLGVGLFLVFCLARRQIVLGLYASVFTLSGLAVGRIIGIILQPDQEPITYYTLGSEILGAALALTALWWGSRSDEGRSSSQ